jgi:signal transduction histidine kinase
MVDASSPRRHRILVVEDDEDVRNQLAEFLFADGFDVDLAADGEEALAVLRRLASFDLIVLDLMLPKRDGWEFRVAQRRDPVLSTIPVIAMSANTSAPARAIDADAYLSKPFEPEAMVQTIRQVLDRRRHHQNDRLASLGRLAAGFAHEVNNPLTYVHASLVLAQNMLSAPDARGSEGAPPSVKVGEAVGKAIHGVERMRSVMSGLRLFIRASDDHRVPLDVRSAVDSALRVMAHEIDHRAKLERDLGDVPLMRGNPGQLGQMLLNLLSNAVDSIPPDEPGAHRIAVRTSTSQNGEIILEVRDTGCGMPKAVCDNVLEPFFTTKPPGLGTGLGLSICHGVVRDHDGTIAFESEPGSGTLVRVVFPPAYSSRMDPTPVKRARRLMIVEDNEHVADALAQILGADYDATLVVHGAGEAMAVLQDHSLAFDAILCDVHLGGTTAKDLYEGLHASRSDHAERMVFMTGAICSGSMRQFLEETGNPLLKKPFNRSEFRRAVESLPRHYRKASGTQMKAVAVSESVDPSAGRSKQGD